MTLTPDNAGEPPLYWQLAELLRRRILDGHYPPGGRLPTEAELEREHGVSRITVRAALNRLATEGLVRRERGRGTFATAPPIEHALGQFTDFAEDMLAADLRPTSRVIQIAEEPADPAVAAELGLPPGEAITRIDRLRLADGQPLAFDRTHLPTRYGRLLDPALLESETILAQLERRHDIPILTGRYTIEATVAAAPFAALLDLAAGAPILLIHRTSRTLGGELVYYQQRHYRGDRIRYTIEVRRPAAGTAPQMIGLAPRLVQP